MIEEGEKKTVTATEISQTGLMTKAVLANVSIGTWSGRKYDNEATQAVADKFEADKNWGRSNKLLVEHNAILNLQRMGSRARQTHYMYTLPWSDVGSRLLPTKAYTVYVEAINKHSDEFWEAVDKFCTAYPDLKEMRRVALGSLWKADDYPTIEQLRTKFHFDINFSFLPDPNSDIRLNLNEIEIDKVRANLADNLKKVEDKSINDLWLRMRKVVDRIVGRLGDSDKIFKNSTFENIDDLEKIVDLLNVTDNPDVSGTMQEIKDQLTEYDPDTIRKDEFVRKSVHKRAQDILDKISAFV